ncbi:hypothetical protein IQ07DRAFT_655006 [Pyrenochaeta sp. DS3sAY3a]|nr:hypothetical protein IQ07DRAFT_655006 [Pyrenochaeta sp. DS3sAY3a]
MSRIIFSLSLLAIFAAARVVLTTEARHDHFPRHIKDILNFIDAESYLNKPALGVTGPSAWESAVEYGRTLNSAMKSNDHIARWFFKNHPNFAETVQSPFDGDLREELKTWGYMDNEDLSNQIKNDCDFDENHHIKQAFDELGLDTKAAKDGGPNQCYRVDHHSGPNIKLNEDGTLPPETHQFYEVCGKQYQATCGTFEFAVNPHGAIALMNVISTSYMAEKYIWHRKPATHELPHIRSISDIAWGMWNRASPKSLKDIKYLLVTQILNPTTREIIRQAYGTLSPPKSEHEEWPGIEFAMDSTGGQAILGSPVGRWAGYFLMQHKNQLGGNRFLSKVRVFKNDQGSLPYLVFYVEPTPATGSAQSSCRARHNHIVV